MKSGKQRAELRERRLDLYRFYVSVADWRIERMKESKSIDGVVDLDSLGISEEERPLALELTKDNFSDTASWCRARNSRTLP